MNLGIWAGCIHAAATSLISAAARYSLKLIRRFTRNRRQNQSREVAINAYYPPSYNLTCNVYDVPTNNFAPVGPPRLTNQKCSARFPTVREATALNPSVFGASSLVIAFPPGTLVLDLYTAFAGNPPLPTVSLIELPAGSGNLYYVSLTQTAGRGFPNEHINCHVFHVSRVSALG